MANTLTCDLLIDACRDESFESGMRYQVRLEPLAGVLTPVKPAIYEGGKYQQDRRWEDSKDGPVRVEAVVVDNVPSQANRLEAALERIAQRVGLPQLILDFGDFVLPPHLPTTISCFRFPHRNADAYLRDSMLDGINLVKHAVGKDLFTATPASPAALYRWMPQALLFGFWQSHLGKKGPQTKVARSWVSEIVGLDPAGIDARQLGLKGDPFNLSIDSALEIDNEGLLKWEVSDEKRSGKSKNKESLSEIGHGQVPIGGDGPMAIAFRVIEQRATVSFASLRRIGGDTPEQAASGRAVLVALGLLAHANAFGSSFHLRSGTDLRAVEGGWTWLGSEEDRYLGSITAAMAEALFTECVERAAAAGLPVGSVWETRMLKPSDQLAKVVTASYPALDWDQA
ncbi:MAG: type I-U CRISPR-associated RAMP protein Csb1/Cas7u [Acidimicrobiia bacterium]